jgi:hypothetical protein
VVLLQVYALALMAFPSDAVIDAVGAAGFLASLVAMFGFGLWAASFALGYYNPLAVRSPIRIGFVALWLVSLASYAIMHTGEHLGSVVAGADRWLLQLAAGTGVAFIAAEWLRGPAEINRVVRVLVWGGAFCGLVAGLQFWIGLDLAVYLRMLPGFALNADNVGISSRAALNRVSGTAIHPIELGVVAGMILPLAVYVAMHDTGKRLVLRWLPLALVGVAILASVSRSAIVSMTLAMGVFIVLLPAAQRVVALTGSVVAVVTIFMTAPGLISTLSSFFLAGTTDQSVASRVNDYPFVERAVAQAPWFGRGGATFFPQDAFEILDNQYLKTAIELGIVGVIVLAVLYFLVPVVLAGIVRRQSTEPEIRLLAGALAGSAVAAAACSFTFDSLAFPMFAGVHALVVGLIGASWRLVHHGERRVVGRCS